jgi:hypothetical protein
MDTNVLWVAKLLHAAYHELFNGIYVPFKKDFI